MFKIGEKMWNHLGGEISPIQSIGEFTIKSGKIYQGEQYWQLLKVLPFIY